MVLEMGAWLPVGGGVKRLGERAPGSLSVCVGAGPTVLLPLGAGYTAAPCVKINHRSSALTDCVHFLEVSFDLLV